MPVTAVTCPSCRAVLTLKAAPPPGMTQAKCPKCGAAVPLDAPPDPGETRTNLADAPSDRTADSAQFDPPAATAAYPFLAPPQQPDEIGRLGPYRVLAAIGAGGMGAVFSAEDPALRRRLALKVMLPEFAASPTAKARFLREARAQAAVEHDHVAAIFQVGEDRGVPFLAMPLLKGQSLADALRANPQVPVGEAVRIAREIAAGLAAAHETGLVHRDVKPGNVWLEGTGRRVKLLDFGLARAAAGGEEAGDEAVTQTGAVVGTPAYMSPEQARGERVDARTDLFSLGVVLYQMLAGRVPFRAPSVTGVLIAVATETPPGPADLNPAVPPELDALTMRLLAKGAADRPATAEAAAGALRMIEAGLGATLVAIPLGGPAPVAPLVANAPPDPWADIDATEASAPPASRTGERDEPREAPVARPRKPQWRVAVAAGLLALLAAVAAGVVVIKITNKDGSVTEIKVPEGSKIEVDGKTITSGPKKPDPLPKWTPPEAIPVGQSPFDKLEPNAIPKEERFEWQPKELVAVIGTHARRHWATIVSVAISSDGKFAATGNDGSGDRDHLIIWDMATQTPKWRSRWTGSWLQNVTSLQFSLNGQWLIVGLQGNGNGTRMIDLSGPEPEFSTIKIDNKDTTEWYHQTGTRTTALESNSTLAVWINSTGSVSLFDWNGGTPKLVTDKFPVTGWPVFATQANQMIYASAEGKLRRATIKAAKLVDDVELSIPLEPKETPRAVRDDGKVLALWVKDHLELWDIAAGKPKKRFDVKGIGDGSSVLSPDGRWLTGSNNSTALWRIDGAEPKFVAWLDQTGSGASQVAFSSDGNRAIVGNAQGFVRFWDLSGAEPKELSPLEPAKAYPSPHYHTCPQIDPRSNRLMLRTYDLLKETNLTRHQLWDFAATAPRQIPGPEATLDAYVGKLFSLPGQRWMEIPPFGHVQPRRFEVRDNRWQTVGEPFGEPEATQGTVSGDGKWMIQLSGTKPGEMKLHGWDVSGDPVKKWSVPVAAKAERSSYSQMFSSWQGTSFAITLAVGADGELALYRNTGAKPEQTGSIPIKTGAYRAAISPDGRTLAHLKDNPYHDIVLEDISTGKAKELNRTGDQSGLGYLNWLAFSPDGRHLAYATITSVGVLDAKTLKPVYEWKTAAGIVHWVDWASDGRHLVTHNGNKTVYVLRLPDLSFAADRKAAEYVLSIGGTVRVNGLEQDIRVAADLPKEAFHLTGVSLHRNPKVSDAGLACFKDCKNLTSLDLLEAKVSDVGLANFKDCKYLTHLTLYGTQLTDAGLANFKDCKNLTFLNLLGTKASDAGLIHFKDCKSLTYLDLGQTNVSDAGLANFKDCKNLSFLLLPGQVGDAGLAHFKVCKDLSVLSLVGTQVTDAGLAHFKDCKNLTQLILFQTQVGDAGLANFNDCKNLTLLNLQKTKVTAAKFEELKKAFPKCKIESDHGTYEPK